MVKGHLNEFELADIKTGHTESFVHEINVDMEDSFRMLTGDINPLHYDDQYAAEIEGRGFKKHLTFGMLTASLYSTLIGVYLPGKYSLIHSVDIKFINPVYAGDNLTISGTVAEKLEELRLVVVKAQIRNQHNQCVSKANIKVILLK